MTDGQKKLAIQNYEKLLGLNPEANGRHIEQVRIFLSHENRDQRQASTRGRTTQIEPFILVEQDIQAHCHITSGT